MKKIAKIHVYILVVTVLLGVGQAFAAWDGSTKSEPTLKDGYYQITNENELAWFAGQNCSKGNIRLMADMDMGGHHFVPLCAGTGTSKFDKIFDGNGFTIKNLYIDSDTLSRKNTTYAQNIGLIAALKGTIKDVNFENAKIYASQDEGVILNKPNGESPISVGVAVGWMAGGTVSGVNVISSEIRTSGTGQSVGGVVGYVEKNTGAAIISNCYSNAEIIAYGNRVYAGGVAGYAKGDDITISGVVFDGTVSNEGNGQSGGILGKIASNSTKVTVENCYYDSTVYESGVGDVTSAGAGKITGDTTGVQVVNSEEVACKLNGGELDSAGECDKQEPWSLGQSGNIALNGSDGYKITFVSNGGSFPDGAKTFKFVAKGNSINSDEIATPTKEGKKFAGWALMADTTEPAIDLGTAAAATKVYAVWYDFYTVSFNAESWNEVKTTRVAKHGTITVDGFDVPGSYTDGEGVKYFFTGWAYDESKFLDEGYDATAEDTLHLADIDVVSDVALYAVWTRAETYSVTFNAMEHGNSDVQFVKIVNEGDKVSRPVDFAGEDGYTLENWYADAERTRLYDFDAAITKNIILYAKWNLESFSITYGNCDAGCTNANPDTYTKESGTIVLTAPSRDGYTFNGWFYDSDFKTPATQIASGSTGNKTVYAKWTEITYTVRYAAGKNGLGNYPDAVKHVGEDLVLRGAVMRRTGYTQVGWATSDGGEKVYELEATYSEDADLTLYPVWEPVAYTITYVCNGCVNNPLNPETYTIDKNWSIKFPTSVPEGYKFGGWFSNKNYKTQVQQLNVNKAYGDTTLYGKLNKIYKITYVGTDKPNSKKDYTVDDAFNLGTPASREGYTFAGWYDKADFNGEAVTAIAKGSEGDKTFYAKWVPVPYTITYNIDGEPAELTPNTYTAASATELATPTRNGYEFDGWYSNDEYTGDKVSSIAAGSIGDTAFFAKWTPTDYTITYVLEEGASNDNDNPASYTVETDAFTLKDAVKNGYTFEGWFNGEGEKVTTVAGGTTGNLEVTAQFTIETYTITYHNIEGATFETENPTTYTVETLPIKLNNPTKDGYTFEGWFIDESFSGNPITGIDTKLSEGNGDLYAKWSDPIEYAITYVGADDLENLNPTSYTVLENDLALLPVAKSGFKFLGWFNASEELVESIPSNSTGNITLTAQWAEYPILVATYGGVSIYENENGTTSALIDDEAMTPISIPENVTVNSVTFNRSFPLVKYSTVVLPFSIDTNKVNGAEFYSVVMMKQAGKWVAGASQVKTTQLVANTPYLLFAKEQNLTFYGPVTFNTSEMHDSTTVYEEDGCAWTFKGTYTKHVWGEGDPELGKVYAFSAHDVSDDIKIGKFTKFGKDAWIRPMRAYLIYEQLPSSDPEPDNAPNARSFKPMPFTASIEEHDVPEWIDVVIIGDDVEQTTPIARLNTRTGDVRMMEGWYDMKGRKLNGKPTTKGTYYNNGKRVVVK